MKKYLFTLGDGTNEKREYGCELLRPVRGFKLGLKVAKLISEMLCKIDLDLVALDSILKQASSNNPAAIKTLLDIFCEGLKYFEDGVYMELVEEVITNSSIYAGVKGGQDFPLNSINSLDEWFSKYPQDFLFFTAHILWNNSTPFFPQNLLKSTEEKKEKGM